MPTFHLPADKIDILQTPTQFRQALFSLIQNAKREIVLCTLYIGAEQKDLLRAAYSRAVDNDVKLHILTDHLRTLRPEKSDKRSSLQAMHEVYHDVFQSFRSRQLPHLFPTNNILTSTYQVPQRFSAQRLLSYRLQELLGVMHWKFYVFDDNVLLSGANLSETYLSDRQDRWVLFRRAPQFAAFLSELALSLRQFSNTVDLSLSLNPLICEPHLPPAKASEALEALLDRYEQKITTETPFIARTSTLPDTVQLDFGIQCGFSKPGSLLHRTELKMLSTILSEADSAADVVLASPYLNLPDSLQRVLRRRKERPLKVIAPTPDASSFFKGGPVLNAVPFAYATLTQRAIDGLGAVFLPYQPNESRQTFHAKGVWVDNATLLGSSNFGERSAGRDLECLALIRYPPDSGAASLFNGEMRQLLAACSKSAAKVPQSWWSYCLSQLLINTPFLRSML